MITQAKLVEIMTKNSSKIPNETLKELLTLTMDGANQMGAAFREINVKRRLQIRPYLSSEIAGICSNQVPASELLFGSNLEKDLTAIRASSKIVRGVGNYRPSTSFARPNFNRPFVRPFVPQQFNAPRNLNWQSTPSPRGGRKSYRGRTNYQQRTSF
jgi:hypothetical protein